MLNTDLDPVLERYVAHQHTHGKPSSVKAARHHWSRLIGHFGRATDAQGCMRSEAVAGFIARRRKEGVKDASINTSLRTLRAAGNFAGLDTSGIKLLKVTRRPPAVLSATDLSALRRQASLCLPDKAGRFMHVALYLGSKAGLRHQEILHLKARDVNLTQQFLRVTEKTEERDGVAWSPKSHAEREVPFGQTLARALGDFYARRKPGQNEWLFPGVQGRPLTSLQPWAKRVWTFAGLYDRETKPGLHQLRRTWASELLGRGADIETVRELGGWADLATVQRYVASTDERKRTAQAMLDD